MSDESTLRVAAIQLTARSDDAASNRRRAGELIRKAADAGAQLVVLPEKWTGYGDPAQLKTLAEPVDGPSAEMMSEWARVHQMAVIGGSITEQGPREGKHFNTALVFAADGQLVARYRKVHLFDVDVGGRCYRESDREAPGEHVVTCDLAGWRVGLAICYDLRFPELFRELANQGAELVAVPAAFTAATGPAHWELLVRARAVEDQCFFVAADQWGEHCPGTRSHGDSLAVDPWGEVLARLPEGEGVLVCDLDRGRLGEVRSALPALSHRRLGA